MLNDKSVPSQCVPLPVKPSLQEQVKPPRESEQVELIWQNVPTQHSFTSAMKSEYRFLFFVVFTIFLIIKNLCINGVRVAKITVKKFPK